ncbi:hypothetical protein JMUB7556_28440 [Staphylococcus aureus]
MSRGLGDVYKRQLLPLPVVGARPQLGMVRPEVRHDLLPVSFTHLTLPTN